MLTAITRAVSPRLRSCQLEYLERREIDLARAVAQHRSYESCLRGLGARVLSLPADPESPDSVFVEDPAVVLDELAVITRMARASRCAEGEALAGALASFRPLRRLVEPATLEGGDVMRAGRTLYVGLSRRTNREGVKQLAVIAEPFGYRVVTVSVTACMHLKTACSWLGDDRVLANRAWFDSTRLSDFEIVDVPDDEPWAANVLCIGRAIIIPDVFPRAAARLARLGFEIRCIDISELAKAEAGVSCMSIAFDA